MKYSSCGKQVMCNGVHFADAVTSDAASLIVDALNCYPEPDHADNDHDQSSFVYLSKDEHAVYRQSDEYACSCGARWDVAEGEEHP